MGGFVNRAGRVVLSQRFGPRLSTLFRRFNNDERARQHQTGREGSGNGFEGWRNRKGQERPTVQVTSSRDNGQEWTSESFVPSSEVSEVADMERLNRFGSSRMFLDETMLSTRFSHSQRYLGRRLSVCLYFVDLYTLVVVSSLVILYSFATRQSQSATIS